MDWHYAHKHHRARRKLLISSFFSIADPAAERTALERHSATKSRLTTQTHISYLKSRHFRLSRLTVIQSGRSFLLPKKLKLVLFRREVMYQHFPPKRSPGKHEICVTRVKHAIHTSPCTTLMINSLQNVKQPEKRDFLQSTRNGNLRNLCSRSGLCCAQRLGFTENLQIFASQT